VQFAELTALAGDQQHIKGHTIRASSGTAAHAFTITADLPGDTLGHKLLVGTQSFAALGVVAPDIVVPDQFFVQANGSVDWGEGSDAWSYGTLPNDGRLSVSRDGTTGANSPQNYAGVKGSVGGAAFAGLPSYQGLYYAFPAESESGWGVNVTHQGDTLFATWFTYDTDGSPMWLVMSNGMRQSEFMGDPYYGGSMMVLTDRYAGAIYRTTGPAFSATPFNGGLVGVTQVGNASFDYTDAEHPMFTYTVNGVTQSKVLTKQVFGTPMPSCYEGLPSGGAPNYQALWWASPPGSESGWGVNITHQGDTLFATWFTYGADGKGQWLVMSNGAKTGTSTYSGTFYRTRGPAFSTSPWNKAAVTVTAAGTGTFTFSDANTGTFAYTLDGVTQTKAITRQSFAAPASVCRAP
jgi:hypothetical protein